MILGDEVFTVLKNESELSEKSISSHWIEYLKDLKYENGEFSGKGLPEGGGGEKIYIKQIGTLYIPNSLSEARTTIFGI
ncbi:MAG: hypothetical protein ACUZ8I_04125 [Candidatus Scalindua sp.]